MDLDDDPALPDGLRYPVWLKPIRSASSELAFRVDEPATAPPRPLRTIREGIARMGEPVRVRARPCCELPPELAGVGGSACLAEEAAAGAQVTVEGYGFRR